MSVTGRHFFADASRHHLSLATLAFVLLAWSGGTASARAGASVPPPPRTPDVADATGHYPDKVGAWSYRPRPPLAQDGLALPLARAYLARLDSLTAVLAANPVFHPPLGFMADAYADDQVEQHDGVVVHEPVHGRISIIFHYFVDNGGKPAWGGEANSSFGIEVNTPAPRALLRHSLWYGGLWTADGREICFAPDSTGTIAGRPLWDGRSLVFTRGGLAPWVPVTRAEYLTALIADRDSVARASAASVSEGNSDRAWREWVAQRPQRLADIEKTVAALRKSAPAQAEKSRADMLAMDRGIEAQLKSQVGTFSSSGSDTLARSVVAMRAELAAMSPAERSSPAWRGTPGLASGLVPAGAPDGRRLCAANPALLDRSRPVTDIQVIDADAEYSNDPVGDARVRALLETADWARIARFVSGRR
jgi:hypothetical protein